MSAPVPVPAQVAPVIPVPGRPEAVQGPPPMPTMGLPPTYHVKGRMRAHPVKKMKMGKLAFDPWAE
jgi:hypothetical protein